MSCAARCTRPASACCNSGDKMAMREPADCKEETATAKSNRACASGSQTCFSFRARQGPQLFDAPFPEKDESKTGERKANTLMKIERLEDKMIEFDNMGSDASAEPARLK